MEFTKTYSLLFWHWYWKETEFLYPDNYLCISWIPVYIFRRISVDSDKATVWIYASFKTSFGRYSGFNQRWLCLIPISQANQIEYHGFFLIWHCDDDCLLWKHVTFTSFGLKMEKRVFSNENIQDEVEKLINSFRSSFWIDEHRWFVRCFTWKSTIYLYTLSNASHYYECIFLNSWQSTDPLDIRLLNYEFDKNEEKPFLITLFLFL